MKCFVHHGADAVGTCRACNKGLCPACAQDLGHSLCCRGDCEAKAHTLHSQVAQNGVILAAQRRNRFIAPVFFIVAGALFIAFSSTSSRAGFGLGFGTAFGLGFIAFGIVVGIAGHRHAKELQRNA
ncbi:hypothetical protein M4R22_13055 [Acidovorax sp. GBBC 3334]|uniref:hypothetical protein n=1 Tax=unclassified Acidovorax TaxID=2684926 RepID=UPI0023026530|nr:MULTISPECIES: hypothetical protein [unclassified Acidovorax]MDA8455694.1 hypothetical protein [Acidovorax sp. GBBC 3334]MDA8523243.1 hypothetical protein [Acidovorax sp. NCPPB 4044]